MPPEGNPFSQIRIPEALLAELDARTATGEKRERGAAIRDSLTRLFALETEARHHASKIITPDEMGLICDALNGVLAEPFEAWLGFNLLAQELIKSAPALAEKWGVDADALVTKLANLDLAATLAILDAAERFWIAASRGETQDPRDMLHVRGRWANQQGPTAFRTAANGRQVAASLNTLTRYEERGGGYPDGVSRDLYVAALRVQDRPDREEDWQDADPADYIETFKLPSGSWHPGTLAGWWLLTEFPGEMPLAAQRIRDLG